MAGSKFLTLFDITFELRSNQTLEITIDEVNKESLYSQLLKEEINQLRDFLGPKTND